VQNRKLASIGIHIKQWVSWHGFALNVATDLSYFDMIVPCGIPNVEMTSVRKELGARAPTDVWGRTLDQIVAGFSTVFQQAPQVLTLDDLGVSPLVKD
jgi:lipoate-protein ligase B